MSSESASEHDMQEEQEEWDDWEEDESSGARCLLSDAVFPTVEAALAHDKQQGFDLREYMRKERLGQYEVIQVINFFRSEAQAGRSALVALSGGGRPWASEDYLRPVLADDELLFQDWEEEEEEGGGWQGGEQGPSGQGSGGDGTMAALQRENEALRSALEAMQAVLLQDEGTGLVELLGQSRLQEGEEEHQQQRQQQQQQQQQEGEAGPSTSTLAEAAGEPKAGSPEGEEAQAAAAEAKQTQRIDDSYFESYSFFDIHREMLGDKVRTDSYQAALECNPSLMKGATVLDVGCGTAILSMFAARAGAAAVIGVDGSAEIAKYARANVAANGLSVEGGQPPGPISIVSGKVEGLEELPLPPSAGGKVDVLVSEWMGYALLFESMLDSVLHARDRFLRPGGAVLPDLAHIFVAGGNEGSTGLAFWENVYGFTMRPIQDSCRQSALQRSMVRPVRASDICTGAAMVKCLDLATMSPEDQDFTANFRLESQPGAAAQACHSLVVWFDTVFSKRFCREHPVTLTTSPDAPQTHWVQTVLLLREPIQLGGGAVETGDKIAVAIEGCISFARNKGKHRSLDIAAQYCAVFANGSKGPTEAVIYAMGVGDS